MKLYYFLLTLFAISISSKTFAYIPPIINVQNFENPKEVHFSFGFGTDGPEQTLSVSIMDNLYTFVNSTFSIDTMHVTDFYSKHYFIEGGFGSYQKIGKYWRFITSGGYAYGQFYTKYDTDYSLFLFSPNKHSEVNYIAHRFFIAVNYGIEFEHLEFYFGGKITVGDYISTNLEQKRHISAAPSLEPNLTVKLGIRKLKIFAQVRESFDTFNQSFLSRNYFISFGLELSINKQNIKS